MRSHQAECFERWCGGKEFCCFVRIEFFGTPAATYHWACLVTFVKVYPFAFEWRFASALEALGYGNNVPDLPVVHEAKLLLACRSGEVRWERLAGDSIPVLGGVLLEALGLVQDARLLVLWWDTALGNSLLRGLLCYAC